MNRNLKVLVLDTSAFIAGFDPFAAEDKTYSVPAVGKELKPDFIPKLRFEAASERGKLILLEPDVILLEAVRKSSTEAGDVKFLSETDLKILALAKQLKAQGFSPTIVTDDYSIQNVATRLELDYEPLMTYGIRFQLKWLVYCPACYKKYPPDYKYDKCEICGTKLKRKPLTKKQVR